MNRAGFRDSLLVALALGAAYARDAVGYEYVPAPRSRKREGRPHRDGTFTRTGAVPRRRNAFIQRRRAEVAAALAREVSRGA